jgi:hypothetical protein
MTVYNIAYSTRRDVLVRNSLVTVKALALTKWINEYGELTCTTKGLHSKTALKKLYENLQIPYLTGISGLLISSVYGGVVKWDIV